MSSCKTVQLSNKPYHLVKEFSKRWYVRIQWLHQYNNLLCWTGVTTNTLQSVYWTEIEEKTQGKKKNMIWLVLYWFAHWHQFPHQSYISIISHHIIYIISFHTAIWPTSSKMSLVHIIFSNVIGTGSRQREADEERKRKKTLSVEKERTYLSRYSLTLL